MDKILATYFASVQDMPDKEYKIEILDDGPIKRVSVDGVIYDVDYNVGGDTIYSVIIGNRSHGVQISKNGPNVYEVKNRGDSFQIELTNELDRTRNSQANAAFAGRQVVTAPMPGAIMRIYVKVGDTVQKGDPLCVLVAMKMENEIKALADGVIREILVGENDKVALEDKIMIIE